MAGVSLNVNEWSARSNLVRANWAIDEGPRRLVCYAAQAAADPQQEHAPAD